MLPPAAAPPDLPLFIAEPDFVSLLDFMSVDDEPAPVPDPVVADVPDVLVLGLAEGAFVSVPFVLPGVFVSALEPLPPEDVPVAPAPDDEPLAGPLALPAPPLWANADVASIAPATVSAKALIHVFITVLLMLLCCCPSPAQLAWRRSATFRTSSAGGASTRASRGSVTGRPSRAER
jgi:hypothetical protein